MRNVHKFAITFSLAALLASCAAEQPAPVTEAPVEEPTEPVIEEPTFVATPGLSDRERFLKAINMLEIGNVGQAEAELIAYTEAVPNSKRGMSLLEQINVPIEEYYPAENFPVTLDSGDSLSTLAREYLGDALQFYALARYNNIENPSQVSVGQSVNIPATEGAIAVRDKPAEPEEPVVAEPVDIPVEPGDTLTGWPKIAQAQKDGDFDAAIATLDGMDVSDAAQADTAAKIYLAHANRVADSDRGRAADLATKAGDLWLNGADDANNAMKALGLATSLNPDSSDAQELLANAQANVSDAEYRAGLEAYNKQDLDAAIAHWDKVLAINPDHTNAQLYKSQALDLKERLSSM